MMITYLSTAEDSRYSQECKDEIQTPTEERSIQNV